MADSTVTRAYEAFRLNSAIDSLPGQQRVESLCCWNGFLLVGLHDGTIVQYAPPRNGGPWQVVKGHRYLARKAVTQMAAVRLIARPVLLTLTEEGVNLLTLPDMQLKFQPMGSRGASMFAWNEEGQVLAVAVRRRVILYTLHGSELLDAGERTAPDAVAAMLWVDPKVLLLGMRRQYVLLNTTTGAVIDVAPTGTAPHPLAQLCAGGQEMLLARDNCTYYHSTADGRYSRRRHLVWSEPLLALTAVSQHAVAVTASGLEVRSLRRVAEGHVVQRVLLAEPQRPVAPAVSEEGAVFVAAVAPPATSGGGAPGTPAPANPQTAAAATAAGGACNAVYQLVPVPLEEQARTLAEQGEYGEALALAALVDDEEDDAAADGEAGSHPPRQQLAEAAGATASSTGAESRTAPSSGGGAADAAAEPGGTAGGGTAPPGSRGLSSRRALLEERLRIAYGHYLFQAGEYEDGLAQLALCKSITALVLLRLFPSLVPAKFKHFLPSTAAGQPLPDVPEPSGEAYVTAVSTLLPYILSYRTRAMGALADAGAAAGENAGPAADGTVATGLSGRATGPGPPAATAAAGRGAPEPNGVSISVDAGGLRPAAAAAEGGSADGEGSGGGAGGGEPPEPSPRELLVILDTAMVRILAAMPDTGALLRLVQQHPNYVDLWEGEAALSEVAMYAELAALYKYNGCHQEGLELLRKLSQEPAVLPKKPRGAAADLPGLPGVWAAVRYIVSLSAEEAFIIQRHAGWILAADPEAGLSALLHMRPPLHPSLALSILNQHSRHYCGLYLETALQIGVALPQDYHNELLLIYLRDILAKEPISPSRTSTHNGDELKELLLAHRPDPDQPPVLFPEDLAHALLSNPSQHGPGQHGGDGAGTARRFASAPASSAGTPNTLSRVPSGTSVHSGVGGGGGGGAGGGKAANGKPSSGRVGHAASGPPGLPGAAGGAAGGGPRRTSAVSASTGEESGSSDEASEGEDEANGAACRPTTPMKGPQPGTATISAAGKGPSVRGSPTKGTAPAAERHVSSSSLASATGAAATTSTAVRRARRPRRSSADAAATSAGSGRPPLPPTPGADGQAAAAAAAAAAAGPSLYQRLRDLVYTSPYIDPGYVLDKLPTGELLEIRALMLERLGNHREALRLYVHALRDLAAAEAYCDRVYAAAIAADGGSGGGAGAAGLLPSPPGLGPLAVGLLGDPSSPGDIYLELVLALFDGPESCPSAAAVAAAGGLPTAPVPQGPGWQPACDAAAGGSGGWLAGDAKLDPTTWQALSRLLSRKRERLDPMKVLSLLPDGVAVADVLPWLEGALRFTMEARRNLAVVRQLRKSENLSALEDAVRVRQHRVVVTSERACSLCHKRIGGAVFVSYPGGLLAHYLCHKRHTGGEGAGAVADAGAVAFGMGTVGGGGAHQVVELQHGAAR